jgi:4'-phosphopantetheinyl transferase
VLTLDWERYIEIGFVAQEHDADDVLETIQVPTLVTAGDRDIITRPRLAREVAARIPGARYFEIPADALADTVDRFNESFRQGVDLDFGKPFLTGGPEFNLSHSGDLLLLGVAASGRLGVDIEVVRPMEDIEDLAARHFSEDEVRALLSYPPQERLRAFFRGWTRKEAFIKGLGRGLSVALDSFSVSLAPDTRQALHRSDLSEEDAGDWVVVPLLGEAEAAMAWDQGIPSLADGATLSD